MVRNLSAADSPNDPAILGNITIEPGEEVDFFIGVYENVIPQPHLSLEFRPPEREGRIYASLVRLDGAGDYSLKYFFANPSSSTYQVTIRAEWPENKEDRYIL